MMSKNFESSVLRKFIISRWRFLWVCLNLGRCSRIFSPTRVQKWSNSKAESASAPSSLSSRHNRA